MMTWQDSPDEADRNDNELGFFRGLLWAIPISTLFWAVLALCYIGGQALRNP